MKKYIFIAIVLFALIIGAVFAFVAAGTGYIEVEGEGWVKISSSSFETEVNTSDSSKIRVRPDTYVVTVVHGEKSTVQVVETSGFLSTTMIDTTQLKDKAGQRYVADRPLSCFEYTSIGLISYSCRGNLSTVKLHVDSKNGKPPVTKSLANVSEYASSSKVEGLWDDGSTIYLVTFSNRLSENKHDIYMINSSTFSANLQESINLGGELLEKSDEEGFVLENTTVRYKGDSLRTLSKAAVPSDFNAEIATQSGEGWVLATTDLDTNKTTISHSTISKTHVLDGTTRVIKLCGEYIVTATDKIDKSSVAVFDQNLEHIATIGGASTFDCSSESIVYVADNMAFRFNFASLSGEALMGSSYVVVEDVRVSGSDILVSANLFGKRSVILVDDRLKNIDSLVETLGRSSASESVSINNNSVFIDLYTGSLEPQEDSGSFGYNPETIESSKQSIVSLIEGVKDMYPAYTFYVPLIQYVSTAE